MGVWASVINCRINKWDPLFCSNGEIGGLNITCTVVNPIKYKVTPTNDYHVIMTIKFGAIFKCRRSINWRIKVGSYFRNQILICTQRLSPLDSWNFDGIIPFTFTLEDFTNCKYLGIIFGANRNILRSRRFYGFSRCKACFNLPIVRTLLYNI